MPANCQETTVEERYEGALLGLAAGDAVGTTVEFKARDTFEPVTDMVGGGPFRLEPGQWTDDTSMALCLAASLIHCKGFDAVDQMNRYCNWREVGYMSSNGKCFDIGITVNTALTTYLRLGSPFAGNPDPRTAGNGALMRLVPIPMLYVGSLDATTKYAAESTRTTHGAKEAIESSELFAVKLREALAGGRKGAILDVMPHRDLSPKVSAVAHGEYRSKERSEIRGTGYCVQSLEAALWAFDRTDSFEEAILLATNLGDDADTTAAICGQLAGAFYGVKGIPTGWLEKLTMADEIAQMAQQLLALSRQVAAAPGVIDPA